MSVLDITFDNKITFTADRIVTVTGLSGTTAVFEEDEVAIGAGTIVAGSQISARSATLTVTVTQSLGDTLARYFIAGGKHTLVIKNRMLHVLIESAELAWPDNGNNDPDLTLRMKAPDPYFYDVDDYGENIAATVPLFGFPWTPAAPDGIAFGYKKFTGSTVYTNSGDLPIGFKIRLTTSGGKITNPIFRSLETNQYVKINTVLDYGDELIISTATTLSTPYNNDDSQAAQYVTLNGENAFNLVEFGSSFFELQTGANLLTYGADDNSADLEVYLYYSAAFANGMQVG